MDRYHVVLSALLLAQGICTLVNTIWLWRLLADTSSTVAEIRRMVNSDAVGLGLTGTSTKNQASE